MKKILSMFLVLSMLLGCSVGLAEMGVQVIGGPEIEAESVSLDDFKLNSEVTIEGYGKLTGTYFGFIDKLGYYQQGRNACYYMNGNQAYESGADAEYAILKVDIVNIATRSKNFLEQCEVKAVYDEVYEYAGWCYQFNYNNKPSGSKRTENMDDVIDNSDVFAIDPMYAGHYCFGCTLPNAVVEDKASLKLVITIDDNEITYNIRK